MCLVFVMVCVHTRTHSSHLTCVYVLEIGSKLWLMYPPGEAFISNQHTLDFIAEKYANLYPISFSNAMQPGTGSHAIHSMVYLLYSVCICCLAGVWL